MARKLKSDKVLFITTLLLVCCSIVMVYSASAALALAHADQSNVFLTKQALWALMGLAMLAIVMRVDYRAYRSELFIWSLVGVVVVMLIAVLFRAPVNGTSRWFGIGGLGIQPSELAKIACVFFTAFTLERRMHRIAEPGYALMPIGAVVAVMAALILKQPDFGTTVALLLVVGTMVFAAGLRYKYFFVAALIAVPTAAAIVVSAEYRFRRVRAFWDPWAFQLGDGFQVVQSFIAIGSGGVTGRGFMGGVQKLFYLPEAHTDFIFSVIGEELGLIGTLGIVICFCVIAWRGLRIAARAEDQFGAFLAIGLTAMIAMQAFVNISVVLGLLPAKGITLPLISSGGSSLLINLIGMGLLLNISQHEVAET